MVATALIIGSDLLTSAAHAGTLYRCELPDHRTMYTDSPAQLDRCAPVTFTQPHSTANASSLGAAAPPEPSTVPQSPAPVAQGETPSVTVTASGTSAPPTEPTCPPGLNPLNPLSAPPCQP